MELRGGNVKNENGKHANSDTRGGQWKIEHIIQQCIRVCNVYTLKSCY